MAENPDLLAWFSKPEEAMNKRLNHKIDDAIVSKQQMLEKVQNMQDACNKYLDEIGVKLGDCLRIFEQGQSLEDIHLLIKKF